jgi:hypothetical protein
MVSSRGVWVGAVVLAAVAACSQGDDGSFPSGDGEGGAPHYDGSLADTGTGSSGSSGGGSGSSSGSSSSSGGGGSSGADGAADGTTGEEASTEASSPVDGSVEAATPEAGEEASVEASTEAGEDAGVHEAGVEAGPEEAGAEAGVDAGVEAGPDAAADTGTTAEAGPAEAGVDASDAAVEAGIDAGTIVPPVCDGVINPGEYGSSAYQATDGSGQTWYMTWDSTNLYLAISDATISEGNVVYLSTPTTGLSAGQTYDGTDITTLPFSAQLVFYAKDGYTEARIPSGGAWGTPNQTAVKLCDNGTTEAREEVIPWSLIGGRPPSFGWFGYLAASQANGQNPQGFIYGEMPKDNPGGGPANAETYTKYFVVPNATPGMDTPFADEQ